MQDRDLTLMAVRGDGRVPLRIRVPAARLRWTALLGLAALSGLGLMAGSWWYLAARAQRADDLERRVAELESEREVLLEVASTLEAIEAEYSRIRSLFGSANPALSSGLWLPPPTPSREVREDAALESPDPTGWPLTEPGFITQPLLADDSGEHLGLDIAIATDSYIRASGAGRVVEATEDSTYGRFVTLEHENGYVTRYAHASLLLVEDGQVVRRGEVIALTGNSGRSTAPHLHFEILKDGSPVDPLTLVRAPGS